MKSLLFSNFQAPSTKIMEEIMYLYYFIMIHMFFVVFIVVLLLIYIIFKFNKKKNPTPSSKTFNIYAELTMIIVPLIIIINIAIPSILLIQKMDSPQGDTAFSIKVRAFQWFWQYEYINHNNIKFDSYMLLDNELTKQNKRLLSVDNPLIIPVDTKIRLLLTSNDVIHSFGVPSAGIKVDCIPGRLNETWIKIEQIGTYYGQCFELCGINHSFMPIEIKVVSKEDFQAWVLANQKLN